MKIAILQNKWHQNIEEGLRNIVKKVREILKDKDIDFLLLPEFFFGTCMVSARPEKSKRNYR